MIPDRDLEWGLSYGSEREVECLRCESVRTIPVFPEHGFPEAVCPYCGSPHHAPYLRQDGW
jgi:hypothetical protein